MDIAQVFRSIYTDAKKKLCNFLYNVFVTRRIKTIFRVNIEDNMFYILDLFTHLCLFEFVDALQNNQTLVC